MNPMVALPGSMTRMGIRLSSGSRRPQSPEGFHRTYSADAEGMQLLQQRDKKLMDVARSVGYESDAAFSKAFKRVVGANPGEYLKRGFEGHGNAGTAEDF